LIEHEPEWLERITDAPQIHLAVLVEPFLEYLLVGKKTVESRFSINRVAPFEEVQSDDVILLKRSGGPVVGLALVGHTEYFHLMPKTWSRVRSFSRQICADAAFWKSRRNKRYASLMHIADIIAVEPFAVNKTDRRAWVVLDHVGSLL